MTKEEQFAEWTKKSSDTEQDKQDRTVRMIQEAIDEHRAFDDCNLVVFPKGSYANQTNVRADSDVDVAVQCSNCTYWDEAVTGTYTGASPYTGKWTPSVLRSELVAAMKAKFGDQVDASGDVAIQINSGSARVDADVVPCFTYKYYFADGSHRLGNRVFGKSGKSFQNYPAQQLANNIAKDSRTGNDYRRTVRIIKRVENLMVAAGSHEEVPSFFMECLVYNCPDEIFAKSTWVDVVKGVLYHVWSELEGDEPDTLRWHESNGIKWLFHSAQKWTRADGRDFAKAAWNYLELGA